MTYPTFVDIYNAELDVTKRVSEAAVDDYEAKGWTRVTPGDTPAADPFLTQTLGDARYEALIERDVATPGQVPVLQDDGTLAFEETEFSGDAATAALVENTDSETAAALTAAYVPRGEATLSILDPAFGVSTGTSASQTAAISAALDANPGSAFYFPPGDYRLDTTLSITENNSLILAPGARLYAGAAMDTLVDYDNGLTVTNYAQDKGIFGAGVIDADLLADTALAVGSVIRFTLGNGLTIQDPVNRGLVTKTNGAEVICTNLRLHNTGTTNATDNVAIENNMGDCQFSHVIARDFTIGAVDNASGSWDDFHPWIGTTAQLTARYPNSVGFVNARNSVLSRYYADTYRYDYRSAATSGYAHGELTDFKSFTNTGNLTDALAAANPGAIFDLVDGGFLNVKGGRYSGHGTTPRTFVQGTTTRFSASDAVTTVGGVNGIADWRRGVQVSAVIANSTPFTRGTTTSFSPTAYGSSTAGTTTYSTQSGSMEVRDGIVWYRFRVTGTFGATAAGNVRIGGFPYPTGATAVSTGHGPLTRIVGVTGAVGVAGVNGTSGPTVAIPQTVAGTDIAVTASGAFDLWGEIAAPFTYPS